MPAWAIWVLVAVGLAVGEILTVDFWLGSIALAAVVTGILAAAGLGSTVQLAVFIVGSLASLLLLRPIARAHLVRQPAALRTGAAALVGTRAVVVERVDHDGGRVRLAGEIWSARTLLEDEVLEPGTRVQVAEIQGATALVHE